MNEGRALFAGHRGTRLKWAFPALLTLFALLLVTAALFANVNRQQGWNGLPQQPSATVPSNSITVALPNIVRPLTPEDAMQQNLARPFDAVPDTPAQKFLLNANQDTRERAIECMTQAVYYEAATEGAEGERAVAQVVLNRMHHPGFPATVCGVVYQGSELPTGCQFTFTCDGSLARTPVPALWAAARKVATQALDGQVDPAVGHATHYHADYVLPYWADSLLKQVQIGHHIFYRLRGTLGSSAAFSQHYGGIEPNPPPASTVAVANEATDQAQALLNSSLAAPAATPVAADAAGIARAEEPKQVLLADNNRGELLIDRGATPVQTKSKQGKRRADSDCPASGGNQVLPTAPTDFHAGSQSPGC
jgi:spore germination cell wall hydrolase CwlJ-like protein